MKVLEQCRISPPKTSKIPSTNLPLTFFDIPWLLSSQSTQPLFFYDFPRHFSPQIIAQLKHSLSLTLHHFFLLAGNLVAPPSAKPHLSYAPGDSVSLTIAEESNDPAIFSAISRYEPRNVLPFQQLVPRLIQPVEPVSVCPLLAVQITTFPGYGFCLGFAVRKVAADCRTFHNFLKTWSSLCKYPEFTVFAKDAPCYDRNLIQDPTGVGEVLFEQLEKEAVQRCHGSIIGKEMVRATFVVGPEDMERIKGWILTRAMEVFGSTRGYLSPYVVACSFVWVCWIKTHLGVDCGREIPESVEFGFNAGGIHRLDYLVPTTYVGNCIGFGRVSVLRAKLMGENGMLFVAKAIGDTIVKLNEGMLSNARDWISDWKELSTGSDLNVVITRSPKVPVYQLDFGWGRPEKVEEMSIEHEMHAISLLESRDAVGGMEVGVCLTKAKMDVFASLFQEGLEHEQALHISI